MEEGLLLTDVLAQFEEARAKAKYVAGHNIEFDVNIMGAEFFRAGLPHTVVDAPQLDTKDLSTEYCAIPGGRGGMRLKCMLPFAGSKVSGIKATCRLGHHIAVVPFFV